MKLLFSISAAVLLAFLGVAQLVADVKHLASDATAPRDQPGFHFVYESDTQAYYRPCG